MPERGARVPMPRLAELALRGLEYLTWPLQLDDYLELISPLWSISELRGRIERVHHETEDTVTVDIAPGFRWRGHTAGQYLRRSNRGARHRSSHAVNPAAAVRPTSSPRRSAGLPRLLTGSSMIAAVSAPIAISARSAPTGSRLVCSGSRVAGLGHGSGDRW